MHTRSTRNSIVALPGAENEIIVFLINEASNPECCHGNKIFDILEFLSFCFITVPSFYLILTTNTWTTSDLSIQ